MSDDFDRVNDRKGLTTMKKPITMSFRKHSIKHIFSEYFLINVHSVGGEACALATVVNGIPVTARQHGIGVLTHTTTHLSNDFHYP